MTFTQRSLNFKRIALSLNVLRLTRNRYDKCRFTIGTEPLFKTTVTYIHKTLHNIT